MYQRAKSFIFGILLLFTSLDSTFAETSSGQECQKHLEWGQDLAQKLRARKKEAFEEHDKIDRKDIDDLVDISSSAEGMGTLLTEKGFYHGKEVFLKISGALKGVERSLQRSLADVENEIFWQKLINDYGFGAKFIGVSEVPVYYPQGRPTISPPLPMSPDRNWHYVIMSEFVPGSHVVVDCYFDDTCTDIPSGIHIPEESIAELERFAEFLEAGKIFADNLQFRLKPDGYFVPVDTEYWSFIDGLDEEAILLFQKTNLSRFIQQLRKTKK